MSVIGVDDHPLADLCDLLGGAPIDEPHVTLPTHLVIRATTGPPEDF